MFLPGFFFGVGFHRFVKKVITRESMYSRKLLSIEEHFYLVWPLIFYFFKNFRRKIIFFIIQSWRKRVLLEDLCNEDDARNLNGHRNHLEKLRAGKDIQNHFVMNYLTNEDNIQMKKINKIKMRIMNIKNRMFYILLK